VNNVLKELKRQAATKKRKKRQRKVGILEGRRKPPKLPPKLEAITASKAVADYHASLDQRGQRQLANKSHGAERRAIITKRRVAKESRPFARTRELEGEVQLA
jgi:hypothetical protein